MILISNISEIYREYTRTQRYPGYIQGIFGLYLESNLNIPKEALGRFTVYSGYIAYIPRICPEDIGGNVRCCQCPACCIYFLTPTCFGGPQFMIHQSEKLKYVWKFPLVF